jgi:hypothetical protein
VASKSASSESCMTDRELRVIVAVLLEKVVRPRVCGDCGEVFYVHDGGEWISGGALCCFCDCGGEIR